MLGAKNAILSASRVETLPSSPPGFQHLSLPFPPNPTHYHPPQQLLLSYLTPDVTSSSDGGDTSHTGPLLIDPSPSPSLDEKGFEEEDGGFGLRGLVL